MQLTLTVLTSVALATLATAQTNHRPISDWIDAQGTFCAIPPGCTIVGPCCLFVPPAANYFGWFDPKRGAFASIDYAGLANKKIKELSANTIDLGTSFEGTVKEDMLPDGKALVTVLLHTKNALTWAMNHGDYQGPPTLGYKVTEVLLGKTPSLGSCMLSLTFVNPGLNAPLPDFITLASERWNDIVALHFVGDGSGPMRTGSGYAEGTPGRVTINQVGNVQRADKSKGSFAGDRFPCENVLIHKTGK